MANSYYSERKRRGGVWWLISIMADWRKGFDANWQALTEFGFDEQFKRLWHLYLAYCEGAFLERVISTHHLVLRKPNYRNDTDEQICRY